jgi:hypothetical protein
MSKFSLFLRPLPPETTTRAEDSSGRVDWLTDSEMKELTPAQNDERKSRKNNIEKCPR